MVVALSKQKGVHTVSIYHVNAEHSAGRDSWKLLTVFFEAQVEKLSEVLFIDVQVRVDMCMQPQRSAGVVICGDY